MNNLWPLLQKCSLFKHKSTDELGSLLANIHYSINTFKENEIIFSPLQKADKIGIILSGSVDIQKLFPGGKVVILERKKSPDLIAESSMFSKFECYPHTISVCKPCKIFFIGKAELLQLFALDQNVMWNFMEAISNTALLLEHKIGILSFDSIQEKIAAFLIHDQKHADKIVETNTVTLPFSKKAWAEYMNVSRTSLSRELRKLEIAGIISFRQRNITIKDMERLEQILSL
ncbi:MAG: Crp/Fnr family transcriptional regulator [Firmicutes bacterium]|nr:Crp/Fnr family transcriptional regulator [Bacillota bacterium]